MREKIHTESPEDLYENAPCGYLSILSDGSIIKVNSTLLSWLNFQRKEVVSKIKFQELLGRGGEIYFETHLKPLLQVQGEVSEINIELKGKAGIRIPFLINAKRVNCQFAEESIYRISVLDISQRKLYEKELIKERKKAEEAMIRLSQINIELERFAQRASHDLQAPLNTISGIISLIEVKELIKPGSKLDKLFSLITKNTSRMRMMIENLLEYSKIEGKTTKFEPVSLQEVCSDAIELLNESVENNNVSFTISELPEVKGVKIQLLHLFLNLFSNSIKYRSEDPPDIYVYCQKLAGMFKIFIKDNGIGFEQKYRDQVFDFMERLHTYDTIEGTGIGLSTCKRIVENHGGEIGVDSEPGKGSIFYFTIPLEKQKSALI